MSVTRIIHATTVATETQRFLCALLSYIFTVKNMKIQTVAQNAFMAHLHPRNNKTYITSSCEAPDTPVQF